MNKNSDTIIIYGGGSSLNDITESEYNHFKKFDSIAVNLFIKTKIHLTHYILGEGLLFLLHKIETETDNNLKSEYQNEYNNYIQILNNDYSDTQIIFIGQYLIMEFLNKYIDIIKNDISNDNIIFVKCNNICNNSVDLIKNNILHHNNCGINCCINYALRMGYNNIIFVGIDLYNSKYAYNSINSKILNKNEKEQHSTKNSIFEYILLLKDKINFFSYNPQSLLTEIIPIYNID